MRKSQLAYWENWVRAGSAHCREVRDHGKVLKACRVTGLTCQGAEAVFE